MNNQPSEFFLIVPLGFEELAKEEITKKIIDPPEMKIIEGGILFNALPLWAYQLNHYLKIPTRLLKRIGHFKCKDFPTLYKKFYDLSLRNYFYDDLGKIKVSASKSRLIHTKRIEETVLDSFMEFKRRNPPKKNTLNCAPAELYIRFENDICTISVDTSGERLHKREEKNLTGIAPLRENFAAGLFFLLEKELIDINISLIDPLCGSGTFLIEALNFYQPTKRINFSYQSFPHVKTKLSDLKVHSNQSRFTHFYGFDKNEAIIKDNQNFYNDKTLHFSALDVFNKNTTPSQGISIVISNPPYGKRIKLSESKSTYYLKLIKSINNNYSPIKMGLIIPRDIDLTKIKDQIEIEFKFNNNGEKVKFVVFKN